MYRNGVGRPRATGRPKGWGRFAIPRNDGRALYVESIALLAVLAILAVALGLALGIPLAVMVNDMCSSIAC